MKNWQLWIPSHRPSFGKLYPRFELAILLTFLGFCEAVFLKKNAFVTTSKKVLGYNYKESWWLRKPSFIPFIFWSYFGTESSLSLKTLQMKRKRFWDFQHQIQFDLATKGIWTRWPLFYFFLQTLLVIFKRFFLYRS